MVMGCDGIWEIMSEQEICEFVDKRLRLISRKYKISMVIEKLLMKCLAPNTKERLGCDNMSSIVIEFRK